MPATRITITTDKFFKHLHNQDVNSPGYDEACVKAGVKSRRAVANTLRALADELDKGEYVGNFSLPLLDTSNWTKEQCLEALKDIPYTDNNKVDLDYLRIRASFTHPECLNGDVDEQ